jgi:hypothetical protein
MRFSTPDRHPESERTDSSSLTKMARKFTIFPFVPKRSANILFLRLSSIHALLDGTGPSSSLTLSFLFVIVPYRTESLSRAYEDQDLTLTLPEGKTIKEIRWLTVWSRSFSVRINKLLHSSLFWYYNPWTFAILGGFWWSQSVSWFWLPASSTLDPAVGHPPSRFGSYLRRWRSDFPLAQFHLRRTSSRYGVDNNFEQLNTLW